MCGLLKLALDVSDGQDRLEMQLSTIYQHMKPAAQDALRLLKNACFLTIINQTQAH